MNVDFKIKISDRDFSARKISNLTRHVAGSFFVNDSIKQEILRAALFGRYSTSLIRRQETADEEAKKLKSEGFQVEVVEYCPCTTCMLYRRIDIKWDELDD